MKKDIDYTEMLEKLNLLDKDIKLELQTIDVDNKLVNLEEYEKDSFDINEYISLDDNGDIIYSS